MTYFARSGLSLNFPYVRALAGDKKLNNLEAELEEARKEFENSVSPLRKNILKREGELAVGVGLAVKNIKDMQAKEGSQNFKKKKKDGMIIYENKEGERYTFCGSCNLYIHGNLDEEQRSLGELSGSMEVDYSCPICKNHLGYTNYMKATSKGMKRSKNFKYF